MKRPGLADVDNAGGLSPYGTMAQTGNATEWDENDLYSFEGNGSRRTWPVAFDRSTKLVWLEFALSTFPNLLASTGASQGFLSSASFG